MTALSTSSHRLQLPILSKSSERNVQEWMTSSALTVLRPDGRIELLPPRLEAARLPSVSAYYAVARMLKPAHILHDVIRRISGQAREAPL